jgi:hypothetical protein
VIYLHNKCYPSLIGLIIYPFICIDAWTELKINFYFLRLSKATLAVVVDDYILCARLSTRYAVELVASNLNITYVRDRRNKIVIVC